MQIVVTRVDAHRYSTIVERNEVQLRVPGYGFMRALPDDLAHFVVEASLGLDRGFWGSVSDGRVVCSALAHLSLESVAPLSDNPLSVRPSWPPDQSGHAGERGDHAAAVTPPDGTQSPADGQS